MITDRHTGTSGKVIEVDIGDICHSTGQDGTSRQNLVELSTGKAPSAKRSAKQPETKPSPCLFPHRAGRICTPSDALGNPVPRAISALVQQQEAIMTRHTENVTRHDVSSLATEVLSDTQRTASRAFLVQHLRHRQVLERE